MKKIICIFFLLNSLLLGKVSSEYTVSMVGMSMDYKEYKDGVLLNSEASRYADITGFEFVQNYMMQQKNSLDYDNITLHIMALGGNTTYTGAYIGSGLGYGSLVSVTRNKVYDFGVDFTHIYQKTPFFDIRVALGVGYRFWRRELSVQQVEDYTWFSLRPSFAFSYKYSDFRITTKFEYQYGLRPRMSATGIADDFKLGAADIIEVSLPLEYNLHKNFALYAAYTYQYQRIKESNVVYDSNGIGYLEPQSTAYNDYIKFGIIFKY